MKVVILINLIAPYRVEFFRELSKLCELLVVCDSLKSPLRQWDQAPADFGFPFFELGSSGKTFLHQRKDIGFDEQRIRYNGAGVYDKLKEVEPDLVVSCEFGMRSVISSYYCKKKKVPMVIWSEGTGFTEKGIRGPRLLLRKWLAKRASGFWTNGTDSRQYLESLGAKKPTVMEGMTGISTQAFYNAAKANSLKREEIRSQYKMLGFTMLFVGKFSGRKGIRELISALSLVDSKIENLSTFVFVGEGPLEDELKALSEKLTNLNVKLVGFKNEEEVQEVFAAADVFVLPTLDDNWPLVTVEAFVSGLPQIGSIYNGAAVDLASREGVGVFIDPLNEESLTGALQKACDTPPERVPEGSVDWATEYFSPQSQADRAHALAGKLLKH